jgi:hypothetical protein
VKVVLALALIVFPGVACGDSAHQETELHVAAEPGQVGAWVEGHARAIEEASGAAVISDRGDFAILSRDEADDHHVFVVKRLSAAGLYREILTRRAEGNLVGYDAAIRVRRDAAGGSVIVIRVSAEVIDRSGFKIAVGLRRAIRGMRSVIERQFPGN